jgi:diaminopimelate decarboxylase
VTASRRPTHRQQHPIDPTRYTPGFGWRGNCLGVEGIALARIAAEVGTPAYVYSATSVTRAYLRLDGALAGSPHTLCYAVKANPNLSILRLLARLGSGFDVVSGGELDRLRRIGVPGSRVVFSGVGKTREEMRAALRAGVMLINVESEAELETLLDVAARIGLRAPAGIRVNPDVRAGGHPHISTGHHQHKFGVEWKDARRLYLAHRRERWLEWRGISAHIGSQILTLAPFRRALGRMVSYILDLERSGVSLRLFDFGGGIGIRYRGESPLDVTGYAQMLKAAVRRTGCRLLLEPGRSIVGAAGVLLSRVLYLKHTRGTTFLVVDAAMNDLMRPALYGATHPATPVSRNSGRGKVMRVNVVGPVCETGDSFLEDWPIERVEPGDLIVLWGAGAYGFALASNYNSRPRPAEVLVRGNRYRIVRRRETPNDMVRGE